MERPLEIAFHGVAPSPEMEDEIRRHVDKLAKLYDRLTGCRVSVEAEAHAPQGGGTAYAVHIVMSVPGRDLAVSHEPHRVREHYAHPDAYAGLRAAFHAAERQLQDYKGKKRAETGRRD